MGKKCWMALLILLAAGTIGLSSDTVGAIVEKSPGGTMKEMGQGDKLVVVWTSGDREVALNMVFMYTLNAKLNRWWTDITFIVWGPSAKLLSTDVELQGQIKKMKEAGVVLEACKACSDGYGVSGKLQELGIDVKYMGEPLTAYIKEGRHVLTF